MSYAYFIKSGIYYDLCLIVVDFVTVISTVIPSYDSYDLPWTKNIKCKSSSD